MAKGSRDRPYGWAGYRAGMRTVGVDLAAEPATTALAVLDWTPAGCAVRELEAGGCDDATIVDAIMTAGKAGIDCPVGWPDPFVEFVLAHRAGQVEVPASAGRDWRRALTLRRTDLVVRDATGLMPLSVSADRIGHAAMRCAALLARLAAAGRPVDRRGTGTVVEVYPAACLKLWGLPYRGYKRPRNRDALGRLVDRLQAAAPWLDLGPYEPCCRRSDDAVDAVIAALAARAAQRGLASTPGEEHLQCARTEGWIALPTAPLDALHP